MPYIVKERRSQIERKSALGQTFIHSNEIETPGELNFAITRLANRYVSHKGMSYDTINNLIGVLECVKMELYARIARPYEDKKISENGDAYDTAGRS